MNQLLHDSMDFCGTAENVSPQSRHAWELWKKITGFSEYLWDAYENDILTLAASELPVCQSLGKGRHAREYLKNMGTRDWEKSLPKKSALTGRFGGCWPGRGRYH